jgi:hypothetical protein
MSPNRSDGSLQDDERRLIRDRSKALLGSQYRAEVAAAIGQWKPHQDWTTRDLEAQLRDIPKSCVAKELATLAEWELVERHSRDSAGFYRYCRIDFNEFWLTAAKLATPGSPDSAHPSSVVTALRRS